MLVRFLLVVKIDAKLVEPAEGFVVLRTKGPLMDGEMKRAANWAMKLLQHS